MTYFPLAYACHIAMDGEDLCIVSFTFLATCVKLDSFSESDEELLLRRIKSIECERFLFPFFLLSAIVKYLKNKKYNKI